MSKLLDPRQALQVLDLLDRVYPEAGCALHFENHFELLCAVMLSAQTTDVSVNRITPELFRRYPDAFAMAKAEPASLEEIIHSIGLYKNKSRNLINMSRQLAEEFGGEVPGDFTALTGLAGVGRKTANVVLAEGFGVPKIAVDTHVFRVSNRIGLANSDKVLETEKQLMQILPEERWTRGHHLLIFHGRNCCRARKPDCAHCPVKEICRSSLTVEK